MFHKHVFFTFTKEFKVQTTFYFMCAQVLFILSIYNYTALPNYPPWSTVVGWLIACSSMICVPLYVVYRFCMFRGTMRQVGLCRHLIYTEGPFVQSPDQLVNVGIRPNY